MWGCGTGDEGSGGVALFSSFPVDPGDLLSSLQEQSMLIAPSSSFCKVV